MARSSLALVYRAEDFDESKHPRRDDGKFGTGSGGSGTSKQDVSSLVEDLEDWNGDDLEREDVDDDVQSELDSQKERFESNFSDEEKSVVSDYTEDYFTDIRQAEIDGFTGDYGKDARVLSDAVRRESEESEPITLYRGLQLSPEQVESLISSDSIDLMATSSFTAKPSEALAFALGKSQGDGKPDPEKMQVVIVGSLRSMAVDNTRFDETESLVPAQKLTISDRYKYEIGPRGKKTSVLVLRVEQ